MASNDLNLPPARSPREHVDGVVLVVRLVDLPTDSEIAEAFYCEWDQVGISLEEAAGVATAVAWNQEQGYFEPHVAKQEFTQSEWGASGSQVQFLIDVATSVSSEMIVAGIAYAVGKVRGTKKADPFPVTDLESAEQIATRAVFNTSDYDPTLKKVEAEARGDLFVFLLRGETGTYRATVAKLDSGDAYVRVTRES